MYYIKIPTVRFTGLVRPDPQGDTYIYIYIYIYILIISKNLLRPTNQQTDIAKSNFN